MTTALGPLLVLLAGWAPALQDPLTDLLAESGIRLDRERAFCAVEARVLVRDELLEYFLVGPRGATHESVLVTEALPSVLNAALLALGVSPGTNARWTPVEPPPTREERRAGAPAYDVAPPHGDGFFLYVAWREQGETYFFRAEDLVSNLHTGRSMRRHRWVYLGSRFVRPPEGGEEAFAADLEQNLVNIVFFHEGHTLATAALPEAVEQTIWIPNVWLLPPRESPVLLLFSREPLATLPEGLERELPALADPEGGGDEPGG